MIELVDLRLRNLGLLLGGAFFGVAIFQTLFFYQLVSDTAPLAFEIFDDLKSFGHLVISLQILGIGRSLSFFQRSYSFEQFGEFKLLFL